jgi:hypothetical protein
MPHPFQANLAEEIYKVLIPVEYLADFDLTHVENKQEEWILELVEKEDRIPHALLGKSVVLDGYCNEIDILSHAFSLKKIYLRMIRRRWKEQGTTIHYSNEYNLHIPGMKTTREFRDFLKEIGG